MAPDAEEVGRSLDQYIENDLKGLWKKNAKKSAWNLVLLRLCQFMSYLPPTISAGIAALENDMQSMKWLFVILPLAGVVFSGIMHIFKIKSVWQIREVARVKFKKLYEEAKHYKLMADDTDVDELGKLYKILMIKAQLLEGKQSKNFLTTGDTNGKGASITLDPTATMDPNAPQNKPE